MNFEVIFRNSITNYWQIIYFLGFALIIVATLLICISRYMKKYNISLFKFLYSNKYILYHLIIFGMGSFTILIYSLIVIIVSFIYTHLSLKNLEGKEYNGFSLYNKVLDRCITGTFVLVNNIYPSQHSEDKICNDNVLIQFNKLCSLYYNIIAEGKIKIRKSQSIGAGDSSQQYCSIKLNFKDSITMQKLIDKILYKRKTRNGLRIHTGYGVFKYFEPGYVNRIIVKDISCLPYVKHVYLLDTMCLSTVEFFTCYNSLHLQINSDKYFYIDLMPHCFAYYTIYDKFLN